MKHSLPAPWNSKIPDTSFPLTDVKTWHWLDDIGYPRIVTVVERKDQQGKVKDHLFVSLYDNNDDDHFQLSLSAGAFKTAPAMKLQSSWDLPKGMLDEAKD